VQYNPQNPENTSYQQNPAFQPAESQRAATSTPDPYYDLVSVLYHALEGAQTCVQYADDAGRVGDQELAQFFVQTQQNQMACSERAKQLLSRRLIQSTPH
jgi:hypothetical protein